MEGAVTFKSKSGSEQKKKKKTTKINKIINKLKINNHAENVK